MPTGQGDRDNQGRHGQEYVGPNPFLVVAEIGQKQIEEEQKRAIADIEAKGRKLESDKMQFDFDKKLFAKEMQFQQQMASKDQKMQTEKAKGDIASIVQKHETQVQSMMDKHVANVEKTVKTNANI